MSRVLALIVLGFNFMRDVIASGWTTAVIILRGSRTLQPGFVRMPYGDLPPTAANFLGALVTLTPGTTTVDIDLERREYVLHILDMGRADTTLQSIQRDFVTPVRILFGGRA